MRARVHDTVRVVVRAQHLELVRWERAEQLDCHVATRLIRLVDVAFSVDPAASVEPVSDRVGGLELARIDNILYLKLIRLLAVKGVLCIGAISVISLALLPKHLVPRARVTTKIKLWHCVDLRSLDSIPSKLARTWDGEVPGHKVS